MKIKTKKTSEFEYEVLYGPGPNKFYDVVYAKNMTEAKQKVKKMLDLKIKRRKKRSKK